MEIVRQQLQHSGKCAWYNRLRVRVLLGAVFSSFSPFILVYLKFWHCLQDNKHCLSLTFCLWVSGEIWLNKWLVCCFSNDCTWNLVTKPLKTWRSFVGVIVVPLSLLLSCQIGGESRSQLQQNEDNEQNQFFHLCFFSFIHSFVLKKVVTKISGMNDFVRWKIGRVILSLCEAST